MNVLLSEVKSIQRSGILQERFMGMIPMRFITGGCGRSYPFEVGIATFS